MISRIHSLLLIAFEAALAKSFINSYTPPISKYDSAINCLINLDQRLPYAANIVVLDHKIHEHASDDGGDNLDSFVTSIQRSGVPVVLADIWSPAARAFRHNVIAVVHVRSCEKFQQLPKVYNDTRQDGWKYLIVLSNFTIECIKYVDYFGYQTTMHDLSILLDGHNENITLWSFLPHVSQQECRVESTGSATMINFCTNRSWKNSEIFPSKAPRDYKKCPLHVGLSNMFPYAKSNETRDLTPIRSAVGCDVEIVKIICDHLNFTPHLMYIFKHPENPYVATDYINYLDNSSLDVCAGGFYRIFGDHVDYSGVYNRQVISWVYSIYREDRHWTNFVKKIWSVYIFGVFYVCYSLAWTCASRFDRQRAPLRAAFLAGWGALTGGGGLQGATTHKQHLLDCCYLLMCMHFSAYVAAKLFSFLTIQNAGTTYETNDDILSLDKKTYLSDMAKGMILDDKLTAVLVKAEECSGFEACAADVIANRGLTVLLSGFFTPLQAATAVGDEARLMLTRDNILTVYHEMLLRRKALFLPAFQDAITRLVESGIADRLYAEAVGTTVLAKAQTAAKNALADGYQCQEGCAITLPQVAGAFLLWAAGVALAALVFAAELVWHKFRRRRDVIIRKKVHFARCV